MREISVTLLIDAERPVVSTSQTMKVVSNTDMDSVLFFKPTNKYKHP
jgi:hypothetical protein